MTRGQTSAAIAALAFSGASAVSVSTRLPSLHRETLSTIEVHRYADDCFKKQPMRRRLALDEQDIPGAGMNPSQLKPFAEVLKDGFFNIDCAKDMLLNEGDKFGDGKFSYRLGDVSNVSIVHYTQLIPKEDREAMSHEVCFRFCRTIPDMKFFGLHNGYDCYCAPYYKPMAGDSSECDAVCPGRNTEFCGGKHKSSVFEMHDCQDSFSNLATATSKLNDATDELGAISDTVAALGDLMQKSGDFWQDVTGTIGQPAPAGLMQSAKIFAGVLEHSAEDGKKLKMQMDSVAIEGKTLVDAGKQPSGFDETTKMEDITRRSSDLTTKADEVTESLEDLAQLASPKFDDDKGAARQYYNLTYFVDKKIEPLYTVCGGDTIQKPMINVSQDACARACDTNVHDCVGYSYFHLPGTGSVPVCFLFSKFKTLKYIINCPKFLQAITSPTKEPVEPAPETIGCFGKLSEFPSSIAPDPSGKCDGCLREADKFCSK